MSAQDPTRKDQPNCRPIQSHKREKEEEKPRDPKDRNTKEIRERALDKTIADSFPTSDPPSSIPDPEEDDSIAA